MKTERNSTQVKLMRVTYTSAVPHLERVLWYPGGCGTDGHVAWSNRCQERKIAWNTWFTEHHRCVKGLATKATRVMRQIWVLKTVPRWKDIRATIAPWDGSECTQRSRCGEFINVRGNFVERSQVHWNRCSTVKLERWAVGF